MDKTLRQTLADTVDFLVAHHLRFALIGGIAASIRGRTRVTEDVDFVLHCGVDDALKLLDMLDPDILAPLFPEAGEIVRRSYILPLQHLQTGVKLDLAIGVSGFEQQVIQRATPVEVADRIVPVATAEDLLLMKVLAGRPQDNQDIEGILVAQGQSLDWDYCLAVAQQLQEALATDIAVRVRTLKEKGG